MRGMCGKGCVAGGVHDRGHVWPRGPLKRAKCIILEYIFVYLSHHLHYEYLNLEYLHLLGQTMLQIFGLTSLPMCHFRFFNICPRNLELNPPRGFGFISRKAGKDLDTSMNWGHFLMDFPQIAAEVQFTVDAYCPHILY